MSVLLDPDSQRIVWNLSYPLTREQREQFFARVAAQLGVLPMLGPGLVYKIAAAAQREFFAAPMIDGADD
jgi:hypothetical protein